LLYEVPSLPLPFTGDTSEPLGEPVVSSELVTTTQCSSRSTKVLPMIIRHTVQLMPGHTVWIDVERQPQKQLAVNFSVQDCLCTDETIMPQECTELMPA